MTRGFSALRSASPSVIILLVIVTLLLLAAIVVHRSIRQSPATRHAVMLMTLVTIGFCPMMVVVARLAWVRTQIRLPNPMPFDYSAAFFQSTEQVGSSTHFPFAGVRHRRHPTLLEPIDEALQIFGEGCKYPHGILVPPWRYGYKHFSCANVDTGCIRLQHRPLFQTHPFVSPPPLGFRFRRLQIIALFLVHWLLAF
jgi:hypothetical protein